MRARWELTPTAARAREHVWVPSDDGSESPPVTEQKTIPIAHFPSNANAELDQLAP